MTRSYFRKPAPTERCPTCGQPKTLVQPEGRAPYQCCFPCRGPGPSITLHPHTLADADPMARLVDYNRNGVGR